MKFYGKVISALLSAAICAAGFSGCGGNATAAKTTTANEVREMTTQEIVNDMGIGINLGNTFESCGMNYSEVQKYETGWGSPVVTREMIQGYADCGFESLRIPVAWSNMMSRENYDINPDYLARVKEVVGWALDSGLYVVMNIHWDGRSARRMF